MIVTKQVSTDLISDAEAELLVRAYRFILSWPDPDTDTAPSDELLAKDADEAAEETPPNREYPRDSSYHETTC